MNPQQQQQWQEILKLTEKMRELAKPNDSLADLSVDEEYARQPWHAISELDKKRLTLLQAFFSSGVSSSDREEIEKDIEHIQQSDAEVRSIGQAIQKEVGRSFSKLGHAQYVASTYASNSSD